MIEVHAPRKPHPECNAIQKCRPTVSPKTEVSRAAVPARCAFAADEAGAMPMGHGPADAAPWTLTAFPWSVDGRASSDFGSDRWKPPHPLSRVIRPNFFGGGRPRSNISPPPSSWPNCAARSSSVHRPRKACSAAPPCCPGGDPTFSCATGPGLFFFIRFYRNSATRGHPRRVAGRRFAQGGGPPRDTGIEHLTRALKQSMPAYVGAARSATPAVGAHRLAGDMDYLPVNTARPDTCELQYLDRIPHPRVYPTVSPEPKAGSFAVALNEAVEQGRHA